MGELWKKFTTFMSELLRCFSTFMGELCTGNLKVDTHYFIVRQASHNCYAGQC